MSASMELFPRYCLNCSTILYSNENETDYLDAATTTTAPYKSFEDQSSSAGSVPNGENELPSDTSIFDPAVLSVVPASTWVLVMFLTLLIIVTIVGNVLVCLSVILVRKLRKPQNYLLVSLATSDLFVALFVMPFALVFEVNGAHWPLNDGLCDLWVSADVLCCTASILNLCGISVDRYRAITIPLEYSSKTTPRRMLAVIFVVWLGSACVSLPPLLLLGNVHEDGQKQSFCSVSQNFWYQIYATMASFYVPLCVMVVVYVKILRVVADKKKQMGWKHPSVQRTSSSITTNASTHSNSASGNSAAKPLLLTTTLNAPASASTSLLMTSKKRNENANGHGHGSFYSSIHRIKKEKLLTGLKEHKASTTLGIIMSAFVICWLPFFVLALVRPFLALSNEGEIPDWMSSLFNWLGYANSALNPVIYAVLNRDFRKPFKEILCLRCSTLDSLMRRDFYNQQFGDDSDQIRRSTAIRHMSPVDECDGGATSPTNL